MVNHDRRPLLGRNGQRSAEIEAPNSQSARAPGRNGAAGVYNIIVLTSFKAAQVEKTLHLLSSFPTSILRSTHLSPPRPIDIYSSILATYVPRRSYISKEKNVHGRNILYHSSVALR